MKEIKISIKGHLNEPIRGLACMDFDLKGYEVVMATEEPAGMYTLYFNKKIHPARKIMLKVIKYVKSLFN